MSRQQALVRQEPVDESLDAPEIASAGSDPSPRSRSLRRQEQPVAIIRIARLWPGAERAAAAAAMSGPKTVDIDPLKDSLEAFGTEAAVAPTAAKPLSGPVAVVRPMPAPVAAPRDWSTVRTGVRWIAIVALGFATAAAGVWIYRQRTGALWTGSLTIQTNPVGMAIAIDGKAAGVTPLTVTLPPASYAVQVGDGPQRRDLTVNIVAGSSTLQHIELPVSVATAGAPPTTGALLVQTEPSGQMVAIDGVDRGSSPLTINDLAAGDHSVVVRSARGTLRRSVFVKAGQTVSLLVAPIAPATPAPGWLSVQSGSRLELRESGKLLGTTETEQIMLAAGNHDIELVNEAIGYRSRRQIEILPNQTTTVPVELPYGAISVNAQPWAEVWINGDRVGETPIANLSRRVGTYEVVFKHPEFGERRETINVTLRQPARLGVDMRSKQQ